MRRPLAERVATTSPTARPSLRPCATSMRSSRPSIPLSTPRARGERRTATSAVARRHEDRVAKPRPARPDAARTRGAHRLRPTGRQGGRHHLLAGLGLANSRSLAQALLAEVFAGEVGHLTAIRLQESEKDTGRTDVEVETERVHLILEAKRGSQVPGPAQLHKYADPQRRPGWPRPTHPGGGGGRRVTSARPTSFASLRSGDSHGQLPRPRLDRV